MSGTWAPGQRRSIPFDLSKHSNVFRYSESCRVAIRYLMLDLKAAVQSPCRCLAPGHHLFACCCFISCFKTPMKNVIVWILTGHSVFTRPRLGSQEQWVLGNHVTKISFLSISIHAGHYSRVKLFDVLDGQHHSSILFL